MCAQRKDNIMLNLQILWIGKVLDMEKSLYLLHTFRSKNNILVLLIDNKVALLLKFLTHNCRHLRELCPASLLQLARQNITCLIKLCGLPTLPRDN